MKDKVDPSVFKKAMAFGSFITDEMKENGADALELQLSFNERSLYENNMNMI